MRRLIAFSENDVASLSFYHCDCGTFFKVLQEQSRDASTHRCECGASVVFSGRVVTLWKTRTIESLFGAGWNEVPISKAAVHQIVSLSGHGGDSDGHA